MNGKLNFKTCTQCGHTYPISNFRVRIRKDYAEPKESVMTACKPCEAKKQKARQDAKEEN